MRTNVRVIRKQRRYSEEFKRAIVKDFESGQYSVVQLEKLHGIHNQLIYNRAPGAGYTSILSLTKKVLERPPRGGRRQGQ